MIANLDPFRGPEPDSGTAFELGFALALSKRICGYVTTADSLVERVAAAEGAPLRRTDDGRPVDRAGRFIEDFQLPCNLMLAVPSRVVAGGLEACLQTIRSRPALGRVNTI